MKLPTFLSAQSIAVIGASEHPEKVGHQILRNLVDGNKELKKKRRLYPINPTAKTILGEKVFADILQITEAIDLIIIATPAPTVPTLIDQMIERNRQVEKKKKTKSVVIISAGFAEIDQKGKDLQHVISTKLQLAGIHLLGPNSLGFLYPAEYLNASFANHEIAAGNLAVISQSGAMLTALFDALQDQKVGVSFAISLGNKSDVNENDCLEYARHDTHTQAIALYLESFADLPTFFDLVTRIKKQKPIIVLKGGMSQHGQQASASHTAALATNQVLLAAASEQMGFALVYTIEELINISFFLARHRQLPENVMVITNAGGPAVNTIDEIEKNGVTLAQWSKTSLQNISDLLPKVKPANPLDLLGDAQAEDVAHALRIAQRDENVDSMLLIITPQAVTNFPAIVDACIHEQRRKPLFVSLIGGEHLEPFRRQLTTQHIMNTPFPNDLVSILQTMKKLSAYKYEKELFYKQSLRKTPLHRQLTISQAFELLRKEGFSIPSFVVINQENLHHFHQLKYPLFAKTANLALLHKKEMGAIFGIVHSAREAEQAYAHLRQFGNEMLLQEVVDIQHELLLGAQRDDQFGLFLTIGLGGSYTNVLADRSYVFLPASKNQLQKAWQKTKAFQALEKNEVLSKKIVDSMHTLQKVMMKNTWLKGVEINPLVVNQKGIWVTDIKVIVDF